MIEFIVIFSNGNSYAYKSHRKMDSYNPMFENGIMFLGVYTFEKLKKEFPNYSIRYPFDERINKFKREKLKEEYLQEIKLI